MPKNKAVMKFAQIFLTKMIKHVCNTVVEIDITTDNTNAYINIKQNTDKADEQPLEGIHLRIVYLFEYLGIYAHFSGLTRIYNSPEHMKYMLKRIQFERNMELLINILEQMAPIQTDSDPQRTTIEFIYRYLQEKSQFLANLQIENHQLTLNFKSTEMEVFASAYFTITYQIQALLKFIGFDPTSTDLYYSINPECATPCEKFTISFVNRIVMNSGFSLLTKALSEVSQ